MLRSTVALSQRRHFHDREVSLRTCVFLALVLQGQGAAPNGAVAESDIVTLVWRSSPLSKGVLLILLLFSAISWGVILYKTWQFQRARRQSASFLDIFRRSSKFSEVQAVCRSLSESPLVGIFTAGYAELTTQLKAAQPVAHVASETRPQTAQPRPTLRSLEALDRSLLRAAGAEVSRLEKRLTFLATTASITPFIGLFGTVWGIMMSFQQIGGAGSTSLAVVAPGIADALIADGDRIVRGDSGGRIVYNHFTRSGGAVRGVDGRFLDGVP